MSPDEPVPAYPPQSIPLLLSRAWNLCRLDPGASIRLMALPVLLQTALSILSNLLSRGGSAVLFDMPASGVHLLLGAVLGLTLLAGWLLYGFVWGFCACALSRRYYSALVGTKPLSVRECLRFVRIRALPLGLMMVTITAAIGLLVVLDTIFLVFGGIVSALVMGLLSSLMAPASGQAPAALMAMVFLLLWGFGVVFVLLALVTFQGFACTFPVLAVATAPRIASSIGKAISHGLRHAFANFPRLIPFALALFALTGLILMTLMGPVIGLIAWGTAPYPPGQLPSLPFGAIVLLSLSRGAIELVVGPFVISALVLFWYDCRVRRDGLDLSLRLDALLRRRGKSPGEYGLEERFLEGSTVRPAPD